MTEAVWLDEVPVSTYRKIYPWKAVATACIDNVGKWTILDPAGSKGLPQDIKQMKNTVLRDLAADWQFEGKIRNITNNGDGQPVGEVWIRAVPINNSKEN